MSPTMTTHVANKQQLFQKQNGEVFPTKNFRRIIQNSLKT